MSRERDAARAPGRSPVAANALLAAASVLVLLALLAGVELALRGAGLGAPSRADASRLAYQRLVLPVLVPDERPDGTPVLRPADPRLPYQSILRVKPDGALRVFTFGGSATAGLGYSPNATFARHLERMLRRALPGRVVEVVNLGIVALSSKQVQVLVDEACARYEPDLVIVYSGNNEFLEIHAEKYAASRATPLARAAGVLARSRIYRVLQRALAGPPETPSLARRDVSREELRHTQAEIIEHVDLEPADVRAVVDAYEARLDAMARAASARDVPMLLSTVASNWKWRGRSDLPRDWVRDLLPDAPQPASRETWERAVRALSEELAGGDAPEAHELLFRRAVAHERLGRFDAARDDYRAAMNQDPHLRRALDAMNERVRRVAERRGVRLVDLVDALARRAEHGIVGFGELYDYVHFTPRGAVLAAVAFYRGAQASGLAPPDAALDPEAYARERLDALAELERDPVAVGEWLGIGFDRTRIQDRDLWKYDALLDELDARLARDPDDALALAYRGNAGSFRLEGASDAARDYRRALAVGEDDRAIRANLEALLAQRTP